MICLNVSALICILSIIVYRKGKVPGHYFLGSRYTLRPCRKDMVIIAKYDTESNEERTVFIHEQGDTGLPALRG